MALDDIITRRRSRWPVRGFNGAALVKARRAFSPGLSFASMPNEAAPPGGVVWRPENATMGRVSIIVSTADDAAYVYRNGVEIGRAPVGGLSGVRGSYVYSALDDVNADGQCGWLSTASVASRAPDIKDLMKKASVDQQVIASARALITPGPTLILTDAPVSVSTRSGSGFNILTTSETP